MIEIRHHFREMPHAEHAHALGNGRFGGVVGGNQEVGNPLTARAYRDRQHAAHGPQRSVKRQFAHQHVLVHMFIGLADRAHRAQDS